jgi:hypothetical protein
MRKRAHGVSIEDLATIKNKPKEQSVNVGIIVEQLQVIELSVSCLFADLNILMQHSYITFVG